MGNVELHFHLLPGLDDGPGTIEASMELARAAAAEGTTAIVATPHVNRRYLADVTILPDLVREVGERLRAEGLEIELHCGAELAHDRVGGLSQAELTLIALGAPGRRWLLVEAPLAGLDDEFTLATEELRDRGFAVVVAHPERALAISDGNALRIILDEVAAGSALQLNAWSLAGCYGARVRSWAERLLSATPGVLVASDAHGPERMPSLGLARDALLALGERRPERRFTDLPRSLLTHGMRAAVISR